MKFKTDQHDGLRISQTMFEQELLSRWNVTETLVYPAFKVIEEEDVMNPAEINDEVKSAQALTGALLWLSTRTRPDLVHGVGDVSIGDKEPREVLGDRLCPPEVSAWKSRWHAPSKHGTQPMGSTRATESAAPLKAAGGVRRYLLVWRGWTSKHPRASSVLCRGAHDVDE